MNSNTFRNKCLIIFFLRSYNYILNFVVLFFAAAICVTGITLSQNNEYKKFLELNKKVLASDKIYTFWGNIKRFLL